MGGGRGEECSSPALSEVTRCRLLVAGHASKGPWPAWALVRGRIQPGQAQDWTAHALHKHARLLATSLAVKRE